MSPSKAKRKDGPSGRFYDTPEGSYPSVTTILSIIGKPALVPWAAKVERTLVTQVAADLYEDAHGTPKMSRSAYLTTLECRLGKERAHTKELAKAGEIGSQVHKLIEWTLRSTLYAEPGPCPKISDRAQWAFMCFEEWAKTVDLKPLLIEQTVWSATHGYAGTADLIAEINGRLTLVDFKTAKRVYAETDLQVAAYIHALQEMGHYEGQAVCGLIVRLPKDEQDPDPEIVPAADQERALKMFLHAKALWEWRRQAEEKTCN
jgi:hypothetical protein